MLSIAAVLLKCNALAARALDEPQSLQSVCDHLVAKGGFRSASIGPVRAGDNADEAGASYCFALKAGGQELWTLKLVLSDQGATLEPATVELLNEWCDGLGLDEGDPSRRH